MPRPHATPLALALSLLLAGCATSPRSHAEADALPSTTLRSEQPSAAAINGGLVILPVSPDVRLHYRGQPVWQGLLPGGTTPVAVIGIGLEDAGEQHLGLSPERDDRRGPVLMVTRADYPEQHLTLPPSQARYVSPDPAQTARFEREAAEQKAAYRAFTPATAEARWPTFRWPASGRLSSAFGLRRFFNGEPRAPHLGVDIAAAAGSPVVAPANGRVALTGDYFFNGRTVIIDHGQGLYSMLCHFSETLVKPGQQVRAGDMVGRVGATGRATAPHLHWTVSLNDARIDPRRLFPQAP